MLNTLCYTALHATLKVDHAVLHYVLACVCICIVCWPQNLVEVKAVLGQQELLTSAYGLIAVGSMTFDVLPPCPPPCPPPSSPPFSPYSLSSLSPSREHWPALSLCYAVLLVKR